MLANCGGIRLGCANDTKADPWPRVPGRLADEVVLAAVNHDTTPEDRILRPIYSDVVNRPFVMSLPVGVRLQVAQVTRVTRGIEGTSMFLPLGIVMTIHTFGVGRTEITVLVDMKAMPGARNQALDIRDNTQAITDLGRRI